MGINYEVLTSHIKAAALKPPSRLLLLYILGKGINIKG
jgi:hypothetical protein